jgi:acyl-CoA dehydrogenase
MSTILEIDVTTQKLLDELKEWSVQVARPLAREADRINDYPMTVAQVLETCPIDVCPTAIPSMNLTEEVLQARPWLRTAVLDGKAHVAGRMIEAITYGDAWAYQRLPNQGIAEDLVVKLGTAEQIDKYVGGIARGEFTLSGWGMTEETGGNDIASIKTTLTRDGDAYILNGSKRFLSNGASADWAVVFATIDPTKGMAGIRAVIVELGTPGFTISHQYEEKIGQRYNRQAGYKFDNCRVPAENFLAGKRNGEDTMAALRTFNRTRPYCNSYSVGLGQAVLDYSWDMLRPERRTMSSRRWDRITDEYADMNRTLDEQRQLYYYSSWRNDQGLPEIKESSQAKVHAPKIAESIVLRCMQFVGPDALSEDHLLEKWYRDIRLMEIVEGTTHIQKMVISRQLLGEGAARG